MPPLGPFNVDYSEKGSFSTLTEYIITLIYLTKDFFRHMKKKLILQFVVLESLLIPNAVSELILYFKARLVFWNFHAKQTCYQEDASF